MLDTKAKEYLNNLKDDELIFLLYSCYSVTMPIWERCSKEEYEKHVPQRIPFTGEITLEEFNKIVEELSSNNNYRRVPIWHNGGGILDQMSNKEPDDYYYEKQIGTWKGLVLGSDMIEYCKTRECMKSY